MAAAEILELPEVTELPSTRAQVEMVRCRLHDLLVQRSQAGWEGAHGGSGRLDSMSVRWPPWPMRTRSTTRRAEGARASRSGRCVHPIMGLVTV